MSIQQDSPAVAAARAHIEAWSRHDWETARKGLASGVTVTATTVDPAPPKVELTGVEDYMHGLIEFAQAVVPGTAHVLTAWGDERRALVTLTVRVAFVPDAPQMTLLGARIYQFDEQGKIADEQVVFFVAPD
jgi:SnoaL-like domain